MKAPVKKKDNLMMFRTRNSAIDTIFFINYVSSEIDLYRSCSNSSSVYAKKVYQHSSPNCMLLANQVVVVVVEFRFPSSLILVELLSVMSRQVENQLMYPIYSVDNSPVMNLKKKTSTLQY